jgi:hypothetical protein
VDKVINQCWCGAKPIPTAQLAGLDVITPHTPRDPAFAYNVGGETSKQCLCSYTPIELTGYFWMSLVIVSLFIDSLPELEPTRAQEEIVVGHRLGMSNPDYALSYKVWFDAQNEWLRKLLDR